MHRHRDATFETVFHDVERDIGATVGDECVVWERERAVMSLNKDLMREVLRQKGGRGVCVVLAIAASRVLHPI